MTSRALFLLAALVAALPASADAHGSRLPFAAWGGFSGAVLRCQRTIAQAGTRCAADAWEARSTCRAAALAGAACDSAAVDAHIAAIRRTALDAVDAACSERQAIALQYLGAFDLQQDLNAFCRDWETAADSAVYGALPAAPSATDRSCAAAAATAVADTMRHVFRNRRRCMDRIAAAPIDAPVRAALLAALELGQTRARAAQTDRLQGRCPDFAARTGRTADALLALLAERADCVAGRFYIQDGVLCPAAACGNGVIEDSGEECDDGNQRDGDGCSAACLVEGSER